MKGNAKNMNSDIKYFLYARKSSESEDRQVQSIDDQISNLKKLADNNSLKITKVFKESKSAQKPDNRPIFKEMISKIENGEANGILCWQINRLSRNPIESAIIQWHLQQGKIKSIQTIERKYLPDDNALLYSVESGMANQFILDLQKNVKRGLRSKWEKGYPTQLAPIGYKNNKIKHIIIEDPKRFCLVRRIWDLMLSGKYRPSQVLKISNEDWGLRTRKGNKLSKNSIYSLLKNPIYKGIIIRNGIEYKCSFEPMVTEDEFETVQIILGVKEKPKNKKHNFAYTGFIQCGECGCLYTAEEKIKTAKRTGISRKYIYYHCTRKKKDYNCSQRKSVREDRLENQILKELEKYTILPEFRDWALDVLKDNHEREVEDRGRILESRQRAYKETLRQLDRLVDMHLKEQITEKEYEDKRRALSKDKENMSRKLGEVDTRVDDWVELIEKAFNFVTNVRTAFINGDIRIKKDILMALGKKVTILDGILDLQPHEWLIPIRDEYPKIEKEYLGLEPVKNLTYSGVSSLPEAISTKWLGRQDSNFK